jgi:signal transduction histidine kinase
MGAVVIHSDSAPLESVLITEELDRRASRDPDHAAECRALLQLAEELGRPSRHVLHRLVELALELCHAGSAGVSILESGEGRQLFRWHALTGALREHVWGVTPREFSPCGVVLDRNATQLFRVPERRFRYFAEVKPQIVEGLLVPFNVDGKPIGTVWVVTHDDTHHFDREDVRLVEALSRVASASWRAHAEMETLRNVSRRKDEFLAVLSHEMRNPLAAMSNAARYLDMMGTQDSDQVRARAVIQRQLTQVARLSEDLLDVSRLGRGLLELRKERTDLVAAVRAGREAALPALTEYQREVRAEVPDGPIWVEGDPARLAQIVTNLLTNGARRTRAGGSAMLRLALDGGDAVLLVTSDTEGVAAGWADAGGEAFIPPPDALPAGERQGIGLALARSLTELHGGTASVVSTGTARENGFEVRLPLLDPAPHAVVRVAGAPPPPRDRKRRERVLVVDDSVDSADSLGMLLRTWGHDVRTAQGAAAGLRLEWEFEPHAVILDIEMPGKNGYEVASELRVRRRRDLLLVALSGHAREEDRARSLAAGFDHHMTKPANMELLRRLLA